jgi:mevalonate kinase
MNLLKFIKIQGTFLYIRKALKAGALGGKVLGAGGGGFILLYVNPQKQQKVREAFGGLKELINTIDINQITEFIKDIENAYKNGKTIFIMGNGGSAAIASHFFAI